MLPLAFAVCNIQPGQLDMGGSHNTWYVSNTLEVCTSQLEEKDGRPQLSVATARSSSASWTNMSCHCLLYSLYFIATPGAGTRCEKVLRGCFKCSWLLERVKLIINRVCKDKLRNKKRRDGQES